ncbi:MAG TPA: thymidylate synthase [Candidatus Binatia bacterium]|jgi:thymidylate synthase|nr:thymidylate synthase [Candidatus Binatia bacterium]
MSQLSFESLGEAWINLVHLTLQAGARVNDETQELLGVQVTYPASPSKSDPLLDQFGDQRMIADMEKVFFSEAPNGLGHSYAGLMRGPGGRNDLQDVISLLRADRTSKRAVVTLCGTGNGKVPCINAVQFLVRDGSVQTIYFARGQDAYQKFYADALCLAKMAQRVAEGLGLPAGTVSGFISSCHIYHRDRPAIDRFLAEGPRFLRNGKQNGDR